MQKFYLDILVLFKTKKFKKIAEIGVLDMGGNFDFRSISRFLKLLFF